MKKSLLDLCTVLFVLLVPLPSQQVEAQVAPRDVGFDSVLNVSNLPVIRIGPSRGNGSDTARVQRMINNASGRRTSRGGRTLRGAQVFFRNGTYRLREVQMRSNVYLRFGNSVTIQYDETDSVRGTSAFVLGGGIRNVSIVGPSDSNRLRILGPPVGDLRVSQSFRAFSINGVENFEIRNVFVNNRITRFATTILSVQDGRPDGQRPTRGTIANYTASNATGGFGAIQVHAGGQVQFRNVQSTGGVTLRLETGIGSTPGLTDITADDIRCVDGRAAITFQPHATRTHNRIRIRDVTATGCGFAIEMRPGFVRASDIARGPAFTEPGVFRNVSIANVTAIHGSGENAQLRPRSFRLIPSSAIPTLPRFGPFVRQFRRNGDTFPVTPLGVILDIANYDIDVNISTLSNSGFPRGLRRPLITTDATPDRNRVGEELRLEFLDLAEPARNLVLGR